MDDQTMDSLQLGMKAYDEGDYAAAFPHLLKAAEAGDREAQFRCGDLYQDEEKSGIFDAEKAVYWFEKAAKQGHAEAQCRYGTFFDVGMGEEEITDKEAAFYWYGEAAKRGHVDAQYYCGGMYHRGDGTEKDLEKALYWYEKAAEQGHASAMFEIGFIYEIEMEPANPEKALYWYEKAAANGNELAENFYYKLRRRLEPSGAKPLEKVITISREDEYKIRQKDAGAIRQWEEEAMQGDAEAAYLYALAYQFGY